MKLKNIPELSSATIKGMEDMTSFSHALIFDDLLIVAQKETACFVWKTSDGLVVIDAIWPDERVYRALLDAINSVGWNPNDITRLILTHGHVDHTGCGRWLVKNHGARTYMSEIDYIYWKEHPTKPDKPDTWKDFDIDVYIKDGDSVDCGDKTIWVYGTPGHTPGCLSFLFPVHEDGREYMAALFGGATPPWGNRSGTADFLDSVNYFMNAAALKDAKVMLCNHTAFDNGQERIRYSSARLSYLPNIYLIGQSGVREFFTVFQLMAEKQL